MTEKREAAAAPGLSKSPTNAPSPFSLPFFRTAWFATLCSNIGALVQLAGASWMMVGLGASAQLVALVQTSASLPVIFLSLWAGAAADNLDRRKVLLTAQLFMFGVSALLAVFAWLGWVTPVFLLACTFLIGCGSAASVPAWHAFVGDMVPRDVVRSAVALNSMNFNIARSIGPAIGGMIIAFGGAAAAFAVNAFSYVGLIAVLKRWKAPRRISTLPRERLLSAMWTGVRYAWMSPVIIAILMRTALFTVTTTAVAALMPVIARDLIGGGAMIYGLMFGAFGLGGVCGAVSARRIGQHLPAERIIQLGAIAVSIGIALIALGSLGLAIPAAALVGGGWVLALSTFNASVQLAAPRWVAARVVALFQMAVFSGVAVGSSLFGAIASQHGITNALFCAAAAPLLSVAAGVFFPVADTGMLDLDPQGTWIEPKLPNSLAIEGAQITIVIEHQIAEADIPAFLRSMNERRRIHMRDGARNWTVSQDLAASTVWVERFDFATWFDYVRHKQRRTRADADNSDALRRLWIAGRPPTVRRLAQRRTDLQDPPLAPDHATAPL